METLSSFLESLHLHLYLKFLAEGELRPIVTMMGGEFDSFRELSDKNLEKLRAMAATNPNLQKSLQMYEQISGRSLSESALKAQEENDLRWERLEADLSKKTLTMGAFSEMVLQYGFKLPKPVPADELSKEGDFVEFMNAYASQGMDVVKDYEEKPQPHTPKCEKCGKDADMKCTQCGERYCSRECQRKAWPAHKKVCKKVVASG